MIYIYIHTHFETKYGIKINSNLQYLKLFLGGLFKGDNRNGCRRPCNYIKIDFGYPSIYDLTNNSSPYFSMIFKQSVTVREIYVAYKLSSFWAEVGGYVGLILGKSLLGFMKLLDELLRKIIVNLSLLILRFRNRMTCCIKG